MASSDVGLSFSSIHRRIDVLTRIANGRSEKAELIEELELSRSTVERALEELRHRGLIRADESEFQTTLLGRMTLETIDRRRDQVTELLDARAVLDPLPPEATIDVSLVSDGDQFDLEAGNERASLRVLRETVDRAEIVEGYSTAWLAPIRERFETAIETGDIAGNIAVSERALERLVVSKQGAGLPTDCDVTIYRTRTKVPYSLFVFEAANWAVATVLVYDGDQLRGVLANDEPQSIEWARKTIATTFDDATTLY